MPIARNGYSKFTIDKHQHVELIIEILAKRFKAIEDYDWVYPNFCDIETHAGEGSYPDPENKTKKIYDSSILRFKTVMDRNLIPYESHLFEIRDKARNDLKKQLGTPFDNFYGDFHQLDCHFDDSPTDNYILTEIIRRIYKAKGKIPFGIIQVDPCGYINKEIQEMFSHNLFKRSSYSNSALMGMDILFSLDMTGSKRPGNRLKMPYLKEFLQTINKKHWFIRGPVEKDASQRILALGTNWSGFPEIPEINMYNINSLMAKPIWEKITMTRKELEIKSFYIENNNLSKVTPVIQNGLLQQDEYLTASDVARRLDRPVHQVIKLINDGELKAHKKKVFWQISEGDLKDFLTKEKEINILDNKKEEKMLRCPYGYEYRLFSFGGYDIEEKLCRKCKVNKQCKQFQNSYDGCYCGGGGVEEPNGQKDCPHFGILDFNNIENLNKVFDFSCKECKVSIECNNSFETSFEYLQEMEKYGYVHKLEPWLDDLKKGELKNWKKEPMTIEELSKATGVPLYLIRQLKVLLPHKRSMYEIKRGMVTISEEYKIHKRKNK